MAAQRCMQQSELSTHLRYPHGSEHGLHHCVHIGQASRVAFENDLPTTVFQQLLRRLLLIPARKCNYNEFNGANAAISCPADATVNFDNCRCATVVSAPGSSCIR